MENIIIPDSEKLEEIKKAIKSDDYNKLQIMADFGRTLTRYFINGEKAPTSFAQIREKEYLGQEYQDKANELFDKFHPIEIDSNLSAEEKNPILTDWWKKHLELMVKYGISQDIIINFIVKKGLVPLRIGIEEFTDLLYSKNIPLLIISQGLGDIYLEALNNIDRITYNVRFISNLFEFDENGKATGVKEVIIHPYNKDKVQLQKFSFFDEGRKNVILLGDQIEDVGIVKSFQYDNLIKIGFLNDTNPDEEKLEAFKKNFDIIITGDGSLDYVNNLLKELIEDTPKPKKGFWG